MVAHAEIRIDLDRIRGKINPDIYGQFIEHVGRSVYGGVFEPGSRLADKSGYRTDVLEAARELSPTVLRWPGGNFASGYHWRDGVGPASDRPVRHDLAWGATETNAFGSEEFLELARRLSARPYLNMNCSTGTIDEAQSWVEYCNSDVAEMPEVALRRDGPHPDPHGVPIWGVGNENYGWWQHGHTSAASYAETAREWAKLLRWADPSIQLIGIGGPPEWNWTVLTTAGRFIDQLSMHYYWGRSADDPYYAVLAGPATSEISIIATYGMCLAAREQFGLQRRVTIAVDEWGVWYRTAPMGAKGITPDTRMRLGLSTRAGIDNTFEEPYDLKDALAVATWFHVLWRHPDKVTLATQAQMVNALGPIKTSPDGMVKETVFYPVALIRRYACPIAVDVLVRCDDGVPAPGHPDASLPAVDAGVTYDPDARRINISLVNRKRDDGIIAQLNGVTLKNPKAFRLYHDDPGAGNTFTDPERVVPFEISIDPSRDFELPPHSWTLLVAELV